MESRFHPAIRDAEGKRCALLVNVNIKEDKNAKYPRNNIVHDTRQSLLICFSISYNYIDHKEISVL
jgi:hypothetical protein